MTMVCVKDDRGRRTDGPVHIHGPVDINRRLHIDRLMHHDRRRINDARLNDHRSGYHYRGGRNHLDMWDYHGRGSDDHRWGRRRAKQRHAQRDRDAPVAGHCVGSSEPGQ